MWVYKTKSTPFVCRAALHRSAKPFLYSLKMHKLIIRVTQWNYDHLLCCGTVTTCQSPGNFLWLHSASLCSWEEVEGHHLLSLNSLVRAWNWTVLCCTVDLYSICSSLCIKRGLLLHHTVQCGCVKRRISLNQTGCRRKLSLSQTCRCAARKPLESSVRVLWPYPANAAGRGSCAGPRRKALGLRVV